MGKIKELAKKATVIIGGMAYDKLLLETNMSDKALKRIDGYNMTIERYL